MTPVERVLSTNFWAVPALRRVDPANNFRTDNRRDRDIRGRGHRRVGVADKADDQRPAFVGCPHCSESVWCTPSCSNADNTVAVVDVKVRHHLGAGFAVIFGIFDRRGQRCRPRRQSDL